MKQNNDHSEYQAGASGRKVYLVGDGITLPAAAAFLIRDTNVRELPVVPVPDSSDRVTPRPGVL
jgi:myosin-crossreactive antigen